MAIFDTSFLNPKINCVNSGKPDPETGCMGCGENSKNIYEQCRQTYYLKKQTELTASEQKDNKVLVSSADLGKENANLKSELAIQINANNQMRTEYSNYYQLNGFTITLIILIAVIAGYMVHFFTRRM